MLAVIIRVERLLALGNKPQTDAFDALTSLCNLGISVFAASDTENIPADELDKSGATRVSTASLGSKPFSSEGLNKLSAHIGFARRRIFAVSDSALDVAAATLLGMPTILVDATTSSPRAVASLRNAIDLLQEPYGKAALELRVVFGGSYAPKPAPSSEAE